MRLPSCWLLAFLFACTPVAVAPPSETHVVVTEDMGNVPSADGVNIAYHSRGEGGCGRVRSLLVLRLVVLG